MPGQPPGAVRALEGVLDFARRQVLDHEVIGPADHGDRCGDPITGPNLQPKLLRLVQDRTYERVGEANVQH